MANNLLLVEKRQEGLRDCERKEQPYLKRKEFYWLEGGKKEAAKKVVRISTSIRELTDTITNTSPSQQYTHEKLKKIKVTELLALLTEQGRVFNKKQGNKF